MVRNGLQYIADIINSIDKILRYLDKAGSVDEFLDNEILIDAVTRNYEIIGEAAKKVPEPIRANYPNIPCRQMYGLRNFAVHEYHIIDPRILWEIAEDHLVQNKIDLEDLLTNESN